MKCFIPSLASCLVRRLQDYCMVLDFLFKCKQHDKVHQLAIISCQVPLQDNESDCGLFLLYYIRKFVENAPKAMKLSDLEGNWDVLGVVSFLSCLQTVNSVGVFL